MDVVVVTDAQYLPWCATTLLSCAEASRAESLRFHVLHATNVTEDDRSRLGRLVRGQGASIEFRPVGEGVVSMFPSKGADQGGRLSWIRAMLPDVLPELDRVIYLDADTLVVHSMAELWGISLDDAPLAAVANVTERAMHPHVTSLGVERGLYFNAGVLVADLERWREEGATAAFVRFATSRPSLLPWFDQDVLNGVFAGRWKSLHPRWNAMNSLWTWSDLASEVFGETRLDEARRDPGILHFEGPSLCKPWHYLCDHPWRGQYRSTVARTPWASTPLADRTLATRLIAKLPPERRLAAYVQVNRLRRRRASVRSRLSTGLRRFHLRSEP
jgi:lipopolysaccharide biosynthesis glycosyltransferase